MADVSQKPSATAENAEVPPTEGDPDAAPVESPPEGGEGDGVEELEETVSKTTQLTGGKTEAQMRLENDHKDFGICIGIIAIVAVVCTIGIVVIHFVVLKDKLFLDRSTGSTPSESNEITSTTAHLETTTELATTSTTEGPGVPKAAADPGAGADPTPAPA